MCMGEISAEFEYNRIIDAINNNDEVFDKTLFSPDYSVALFFEQKQNAHVVNVLNAPEAYTYMQDNSDGNTEAGNTPRQQAEIKFNEIVNNGN